MNIILLILLGFIVFKKVRNGLKNITEKISRVFLILFTITHFFIAIFAWYWSLENGKDALTFFRQAAEGEFWLDLLGIGSTFVSFLIYPLVKIGINYFTLFILFSTISYIGYTYYLNYLLNINFAVKKHKIMMLFFFLPSLHFWTGFISKDVLVFFLMSYLIVKIRESKYYTLQFIIAFLLIGVIRPHIFFVLMLAFFMVLILSKKIRFSYILFVIALIGINCKLLLKFIGISGLSKANIINKLQEYNNYSKASGNSHIDLFETTYFERIFTLLFRPLFYDAQGAFQLCISVENSLFLLLVLISLINFKKLISVFNSALEGRFAIISSVFIILLISIYIYNLGLASRMRVMITPYFLYVFLLCFEKKENAIINDF